VEDHSDKYNDGRSPLNKNGNLIIIMHNQKFLNSYFTNTWQSTTADYVYSGYAILEQISNDDLVIDVGCGTNPFKGEIKNLIGIDPTNIGADVVTTIENFTSHRKFDVALCLGSINFGTEQIIAKQIEKVNNLLLPNARIFWRLNPGTTHDHPDADEIDFYPWSFEKLAEYAEVYGFNQINCAIDSNGVHTRLYAEWHR